MLEHRRVRHHRDHAAEPRHRPSSAATRAATSPSATISTWPMLALSSRMIASIRVSVRFARGR
jgi:hypothetical protein